MRKITSLYKSVMAAGFLIAGALNSHCIPPPTVFRSMEELEAAPVSLNFNDSIFALSHCQDERVNSPYQGNLEKLIEMMYGAPTNDALEEVFMKHVMNYSKRDLDPFYEKRAMSEPVEEGFMGDCRNYGRHDLNPFF